MLASRRAAHLLTIKRADSPPANDKRTTAAVAGSRRTADIGMGKTLAYQDGADVPSPIDSEPHMRPKLQLRVSLLSWPAGACTRIKRTSPSQNHKTITPSDSFPREVTFVPGFDAAGSWVTSSTNFWSDGLIGSGASSRGESDHSIWPCSSQHSSP